MPYDHIQYDVSESIATITIDRPDNNNAYIPDMGDEIVAAFRAAEKDSEVRVVILTAAGERIFCAGADKVYLQQPLPEGVRVIGEEELIKSFALELANFPKPTIAAFNGHAMGIGMTMTLPCDMRIAAAGIKMGFIFSKLGILLGLGSSHLLPSIIGMSKAQELVMTARVFLSEEAAEMGLVNKVVPREDLMKEARAMAQLCVECEPNTLRFAKRALHYGATHTLEEAMTNEKAKVIALAQAKVEQTKLAK